MGSDRQQRRAQAARIRQLISIGTPGALAIIASAVWKPLIEGSAPFTGRSLFFLGIALFALCITVGLAPYGEHHEQR